MWLLLRPLASAGTPSTRSPKSGRPALGGLYAAVCAVTLLTGCASTPAPMPMVQAPTDEQMRSATPPAPPTRTQVPVASGAYYHFLRAYQLEMGRRVDAALSEYLAALTYAPESEELLYRVSQLYLKNGDAQGAIETAEQSLKLYPNNPRMLQFLARLYQKQGQGEQAEALYLKLIDRSPVDPQPIYQLVMVYAKQDRFDDAFALIDKARARDRKSALPDYYSAQLYRAQAEPKKAIKSLKRAIRKNPQFEAALLELAAWYQEQGHQDRAIGVYRRIVEQVNPSSPYARDRLIQHYLKLRDVDEVLAQYNALLTINPRNPFLLYRKALMLGDMERYDEAILAVSQSLGLRPGDLAAMDLLATLYQRSDQYPEARATLIRILEADPGRGRSWIQLGYMADAAGDDAERDRAVEAAAKLLESHPDDLPLFQFVGWGYVQAKRFPEAVTVLRQAVELNPDSVGLHFSLGAALYELGEYKQMEEEMVWVLERDPKHVHAMNFLAYSYAEQKIHLDKAIELLQRALANKPDNGFFLDSLAWVYYQQDRYEDALPVQLKAVEQLTKKDPVVYDHLGSIYLKLGQQALARDNWIISLELDPSNDELRTRFREAGFGNPDEYVAPGSKPRSGVESAAVPLVGS